MVCHVRRARESLVSYAGASADAAERIRPMTTADTAERPVSGTQFVLITLAAGQFVMALDTTVMNTAIATVAKDLGTTVVGIQTAITLYMPAIVALVATNFGKPERPRAYGLVAAAGAIAAALGPVIGGAFTTYWSWRWVFAGEVLIVLVILLLARRMNDTAADREAKLDLVGTGLSALGLGAIVLGLLKSGTWGFVQPKPDAPEWLGLSPVIWMILGGAVVLALFGR